MKKTVLITGAGRGLGRALAAFASEQGADVIALVRAPLSEALPCEIINGVDVTDEEALNRVSAILGDRPIDLLINNAGIIGPERQSTLDMDFEGFRLALEVNTLAPLRVVQAVLPNLRAARDRAGIARIVTVSSQMGRMNYMKSDRIAYRASKTAVNKVMQGLATDLAAESIAVRVVDPGWVRTEMGGPDATVGVADAVAGIYAQAWATNMELTGTFVDYRGDTVPW